MSFINSNIIRFHGKSRKGSENVEIRERILTLENLYQSYRQKFDLLCELQVVQNSPDLELLRKNLQIIEKEIEKLANLIK